MMIQMQLALKMLTKMEIWRSHEGSAGSTARQHVPLNCAAVRRLKIALKWPFGDCVGWEIGELKVIQLFATRVGINKGRWLFKFEDGVEYYWPKEPNSAYGRNKN